MEIKSNKIKPTKFLVIKGGVGFFVFTLIFLVFSFFPDIFPYLKKGSETPIDMAEQITANQKDRLLFDAEIIANYLKDKPSTFEYFLPDSIEVLNKRFCLIYENDSLIYWNSSEINPYDADLLGLTSSAEHVFINSNLYLTVSIPIDSKKLILLEKIDVETNPGNPQNINFKSLYFFLSSYAVFLILIFICLYIFIHNYCSNWSGESKTYLAVIISSLLILMQIFEFYPDYINDIEFLNLGTIGSLTKASLLFITLIILSTASVLLLITRKSKAQTNYNSVFILLSYIGLLLFIIVAALFISTVTGLLDFRIFDGATSVTRNLGYAFVIITFMNFGLYLAFQLFVISSSRRDLSILIPIIIGLSSAVVVYIIPIIDILTIILSFTLFLVMVVVRYYMWDRINDLLIKNLLLIIILTIFTALIVNSTLEKKSYNYQQYIAKILSTENDVELESTLDSILPNIRSDSNLLFLLRSDTAIVSINQYLQNKYFDNSLYNYNVQITICDEYERIEIQPELEIYNCWEYFNTLINDYTVSAIDTALYRFNTSADGYYYIAPVSIFDSLRNTNYNIYIEFITSFVPEGLGYPELLINHNKEKINLYGYSYAVYEEGILIFKFGDYQYNTVISDNDIFKIKQHTSSRGFKHYTVIKPGDMLLVVSKKELPLTLKVFTFSFTFLLFSLLGVLIYFIRYSKRAFQLFRINYKSRLQFFVLSSLTITFSFIAISTFLFLKENTRLELEKQLQEKTNSVLIELQHKLSDVQNLKDEDPDMLHSILRKFSLVFFSDINIYDRSGELIATSRPEIFDKGLLSTMVNPKAFKAIFIDNELSYITEENIGDINYYSSYVPLNLSNIFPIGIVNLPYFARQSEYTRSYYIMLSYLINIYVIIGIMITIIAVAFARVLTKPLVLLKQNISSIRIDQRNERIVWKGDDEIGILIKEYNRMVDKLEESAELLIRSERESTWREMAKQIAHEIKNPLTPMKLNVQYLEKAYSNNDPDFKSKLSTVSSSLITQIETLNNVAEMFSDFAKNSSSSNETTNLTKIVETASRLFDKKTNIAINIKIDNEYPVMVRGNENDILRAVNNIIQNSVQAIGSNKGIINISLLAPEGQAILTIEDNGKGISEDAKARIFQPYFTTKNSGTGLGLAIVKNIINESAGDISFESTEGVGTVFTIKFKLI